MKSCKLDGRFTTATSLYAIFFGANQSLSLWPQFNFSHLCWFPLFAKKIDRTLQSIKDIGLESYKLIGRWTRATSCFPFFFWVNNISNFLITYFWLNLLKVLYNPFISEPTWLLLCSELINTKLNHNSSKCLYYRYKTGASYLWSDLNLVPSALSCFHLRCFHFHVRKVKPAPLIYLMAVHGPSSSKSCLCASWRRVCKHVKTIVAQFCLSSRQMPVEHTPVFLTTYFIK